MKENEMRLRDIIGELETLYHPKIAEDWDNVGLLIGDENRDINKMLFCLDLTEKAVPKLATELKKPFL